MSRPTVGCRRSVRDPEPMWVSGMTSDGGSLDRLGLALRLRYGGSYCLPVVDGGGRRLPRRLLRQAIERLFAYARAQPVRMFNVSHLIPWRPNDEDLISQFADAPDNVILPLTWRMRMDEREPPDLSVTGAPDALSCKRDWIEDGMANARAAMALDCCGINILDPHTALGAAVAGWCNVRSIGWLTIGMRPRYDGDYARQMHRARVLHESSHLVVFGDSRAASEDVIGLCQAANACGLQVHMEPIPAPVARRRPMASIRSAAARFRASTRLASAGSKRRSGTNALAGGGRG